MGFVDFFSKMNMATGGKNPNDALFDAMRNLGLHQTQSHGTAVTETTGTFRGRHARVLIDGSAVMQAGNHAMMQAASLGAASALGVVSPGWASWKTQLNEHRARSGMRSAQMHLMFAVHGGQPVAPVLFGRDPSAGHPIAPGLFCQTTQEAWPHLAQPYVLEAVSRASFDRIGLDGPWVQAMWSPEMQEYQQTAASPGAFGDCVGRGLTAVSALADILCGAAR